GADKSGAPVTKAAKRRVVDEQYQGSPDDRGDGTIDVEAAGPRHTEEPEQPPTDNGANDSKQNVDDDSLSSAVYDPAGNETGNESENDPRKQRHVALQLANRARPRTGAHLSFRFTACSRITTDSV